MSASAYVCPLCNGTEVVKRRGAKAADNEPASRAMGNGWRTTPCIACVLDSYSFEEILSGLRLRARQATPDPGAYLVPQVKLDLNYPNPSKRRKGAKL